MKTLKLELDFLMGPIVKDVFSASKNKLITGVEVIDNDLELNELNEKASALYSSFYEFDEDEACRFDSTIAKEHLVELKELITKITLLDNNIAKAKRELGPITISFDIPNFNLSKVQIKECNILTNDKKYNPAKWLRMITQAYSYVFRLS